MTIRVLLCDDQVLVAEGLQYILESDPEIEIVGIASDGAQAIEMIPANKPDIVLMDLKMPRMNGVQATTLIRRDYPDIPVLVLTTFDGDQWVFDAIRAGASGYLLKDTPRQRLITAVKETVIGKSHIDPSIAGKLLDHFAHPPQEVNTTILHKLTDREIEILRLVAQGLSNAVIGERLFLSEGTVRNYMSTMFEKLGVSDRTQAAVLALKHGIKDYKR